MARTRFLIVALFVSGLAVLLSLACDDLVTETINTTIAGHPTAEFRLQSGYNDSGCVPFEVGFDDQSSGPITRWTWYFGDGDSVVNDTNPVHIYDSAGVYACTLKVEDTATDGIDVEVKSRFVVVGTVLADFSSADTVGCAGQSVYFQASGLGGVTSLRWDYGDGSFRVVNENLDSPVVRQYAAEGLYTVTLTATGDCGQKEITKTDYIRVVECPVAVIGLDADRGCIPFKVHFADTLSTVPAGEIIGTHSWDFGNGRTSNKAVDSVDFTTADTFVVRLAVSASNGGVDTAYDTVIGVAPTQAAFTALTPTTGCLIPNRQFQVKFQSQSVGEIDSLLWEFGDGDTSWNDPSPIHAYEEGFYSVILRAYGECGTDVVENEDFVVVSAPFQGEASFGIWENFSSSLVTSDTILADSNYTFFENAAPSAIKRRYWFFASETPQYTDSLVPLVFDDTSVHSITVNLSIANECDSLTATRTLTIIHPTP